MGIRFLCPNGHKLNVKAFLAGRRGICPYCGAKFQIPAQSTLPSASSSPNERKAAPNRDHAAHSTSDATAFEQDLEAHVRQTEAGSQGSPVATAVEETNVVAASAQPASETTGSDGSRGPSPGEPDEPVSEPNAETLSNAAIDQDGSRMTGPAAATPAAPTPPQPAAVPDPLSESPSAVWYVRPPSGGQFGPAQADVMRTWLNEGRVSPETLVWREGWADWQEAVAVFAELQPTSQSPGAPPVATSSAADGAAAETYRTGPRRRRSGPNTGLIVVLTAAVLLLLVILILILSGGLRGDDDTKGNGEVAISKGPLMVACDTTLPA